MAHPASPFLSVLILMLVAAVTAAAILVLSGWVLPIRCGKEWRRGAPEPMLFWCRPSIRREPIREPAPWGQYARRRLRALSAFPQLRLAA